MENGLACRAPLRVAAKRVDPLGGSVKLLRGKSCANKNAPLRESNGALW